MPCSNRRLELQSSRWQQCCRAWRSERAGTVAAMAAVMVMVVVTAAATGISAAEATGILAGTMAAAGTWYHDRFRGAVFTATVLLPDAAARISARSGTPRS